MTVTMKLKYIDKLGGGRLRFRRRFPKDVQPLLGEEFFQVPMKAREGHALVTERERMLAAFEKVVRQARGRERMSPLERWRASVVEADQMQAEVRGFEGPDGEDDRREVLAESLQQQAADPMLVKAVMAPKAKEPEVTLRDARNIYLQERLRGVEKGNNYDRLKRVSACIEKTLGKLEDLALIDLRREHARKLRDAMLATPKADGSLRLPSSVARELTMVRTMIAVAITEFDLQGKVSNPFENLEIAGADARPETDSSKRDPLPASVILAMRKRLQTSARDPALGHIWRLLEGTGCRVSEVAGLRVQDVDLVADVPHIRVQWHEDRRVKTKVSIRSVPLIGDALSAAREAVKLAGASPALFPKYASQRGGDAASAALMKHLRTITKNRRHVNHSLRHNMKDWLSEARVDDTTANRILGHAQGSLGNRVYGGDEAKLRIARDALTAALRFAPSEAR
ncbi:tyrosine-type recombinase/integrase [Jannaschia seohaensis]|nr:tyrosine-type recombinase/integrase [Jannaschia seohaensis]